MYTVSVHFECTPRSLSLTLTHCALPYTSGCGKTSMLEIITGIPMPKGRHCPTVCPVEFNIVRDLRQDDGEIVCEIHIKWRYDDDTMQWVGAHANSGNTDENENGFNEQNESKRNETDNGQHDKKSKDGDQVLFATPNIMDLSQYIVDAQKHIAEKLQDRYVILILRYSVTFRAVP